MKELLMSLLKKTLNLNEEEINAIILKEGTEDEINEEALQQLLDKDASRITAIKDANKGSRDDQYKRGQKETAEKFEKGIKSVFGIEDDLNGDELIAKAKETIPSGSGESTLTDDDVKTHPVFIALQKEKSKEIAQLQTDQKKALADAEGEFNSKMTRSSINAKAIAHIRGKNPKLPDDTAKANKRLNTILPELAKYKFEQNGNDITVKNEDGTLLEDGHGNAVTFNKLVDTLADDFFDFESGEGGEGSKGTGNGGDGFGKGSKFDTVTVPDSPEALQKAMEGAKSPEERTAISKAYLEAQKDGD